MRRKQTLVLVVLSILSVCVVLWDMWPNIGRFGSAWTYGRWKMRFLDATYGTEHTYVEESGWIASHIPESARKWLRLPLGRKHTVGPSANPSLVLWFEVSPFVELPEKYWFTSDDGSEFLAETVSPPINRNVRPEVDVVVPVEFQYFPRRARSFEVRAVLESPGPQITYPIKVRNPVSVGVLPSGWLPSSMPANSIDRDTVFTLKDLITVKPKVGLQNDVLVSLPFEVTEKGIPASQWCVRPLKISDGGGNVIVSFQSDSSNGLLTLSNAAVSSEPWKVELEYFRISNFRESELVELADIPIRAKNMETSISREIIANGLKSPIGIDILQPGGNYGPAPRSGRSVNFGLVNRFSDDTEVVLVRAIDNRGNVTQDSWRAYSRPEFDGIQCRLKVPVAADAKSVSVTVAIVPVYRAEFTVQPRIVPAIPE